MITCYLRVSTLRQKEEGASIETQKRMIIDYALKFEIIKKKDDLKIYCDDGFSGKTLQRPAMQQLIEDIKSGQVDVIFAYDLSRISRDLFDSNVFFNLINKYKVSLKCLYEDVKIKTAGDRFTTNIKVLNNQYERERIVERTNDGLRGIAESGRYPVGGKIFFGYIRGKDKNIYMHPINSKIIIKAVEMGKQNKSIEEIKDFLNKNQNELFFTIDRVRILFKDKRYAGIFEYKGKIYTNIIPPLVSLQDLQEASEHYKRGKFKKNEKYYFDGIVYCSVCGTRMTCLHSYGKKKIYYYYGCRKCNMTIGQLHIEEYLNNRILPNIKKDIQKKELKKERIKLRARIKRYREKLLDERISDREFCSLVIPLEDRLNNVEILLKGLNIQANSLCYSSCITEKEKKAFALAHIERIEVDPNNKRVIEVIPK